MQMPMIGPDGQPAPWPQFPPDFFAAAMMAQVKGGGGGGGSPTAGKGNSNQPGGPSASANRRRRRQRAQQNRRSAEAADQAADSGPDKEEEDEEEDGSAEMCNEVAQQLDEGPESKAKAVATLTGKIRELSFKKIGCRVVQKAIEVSSLGVAAALAGELQGAVQEAIESPHANYVIQKVIEVLPAAHAGFVVGELTGKGGEVARHRYGCRVLCRLLEHHSCGERTDGRTSALINEVLTEVVELSRHNFGHHVIQSILEHGTQEQRCKIAVALRGDLLRNAKNRNASFIVERALAFCTTEDQQIMAAELLSNAENLPSLAENQFGCHVAKALLRLPGEHSRQALNHLQIASAQLQTSKYGRRLLAEFKLNTGTESK